MRPYILAESNWKDVSTQEVDLVILPWGATEAHNYHLPYATDVFESDHLAAEAARLAHEQGARVMVLPTIPFGVNTGQRDIYLDINLMPSTMMAIVGDVLDVLDDQGVKKFMIFNSHGGNDFKPILRELGLQYPDMFLTLVEWFRIMDHKAYFDEPGDHADEMETSLMLHLRPDLVRPLEDAGEGKDNAIKIQGIREGWAWTERRWSLATNDTGVGDPRKATANKGERFFKDVTNKLSGLLVDIANSNLSDLYEKP
ncbi:MAG: creatininase family protein [Candidatus Marinimicrobia bacterium]|nr:creatininase family protein [Candidatus Neomarinimicrobiota bacterium]MCF7904612.1 creatininase family protein [Candidatus Neomarinimicrobiota bacterium]